MKVLYMPLCLKEMTDRKEKFKKGNILIKEIMIGIVDVGGGNRGIYGAGVLDYCLDHGINFDYFIGVSAGSANGVSYLSKQKLRNYQFYTDYSFRQEYMGIVNFLRNRSFVNLDYVYSTLSNSDGENPVDYDAFIENQSNFVVVATNADTGQPVYFYKKDIKKDNYDFMKASSCVPVACSPYKINGKPYYDGGISDPIPFKKAFDDGCEKVIIILTKPKQYRRVPDKDVRLSKFIQKKYPNSAMKLANRSHLYNTSLEEALKLEKEGKVLIIAPNDLGNLDTFSRNKEQLDLLYKKGYYDAKKIKNFLLGTNIDAVSATESIGIS